MTRFQRIRSLAVPLILSIGSIVPASAQAPGGVANPTAWFKANSGVVVVGPAATAWTNSATNLLLPSVPATQGVNALVTNNAVPFNFNPFVNLANGAFSAALAGMNNVLNTSEGSLFGVSTTPDQTVAVTETTAISPCGGGRCNSGTRGTVAEFGGVGVNYGGATNANVANLFGTSASILATPNQTVTRNGFKTTGASASRSVGTYQFAIGAFPGFNYTGNISEVVGFNRLLTAAEYARVESYLALKYGITLGNNASPRDYIISTGTNVWPANTSYQNNITGIGQDNGSGLTQKQSKSVYTPGIVALYNGNTGGTFPAMNTNNTSTIPANNSWLVVGDNGQPATYGTCSVDSPRTFARISRIWLARQTGTNGPQTIAVLKADLPSTIKFLVISNDTNFNPATSNFLPLQNGGTTWYASATLTNNQYFTFASDTVQIVAATSNSPICAGSSLNLFSTPSNAASGFSWTGPNGFTSTARNPTITGATVAATGTYTVKATFGGCTGTAFNVPVVVNAAITTDTPIVLNNPITCAGSNGSIAVPGLQPNVAYTVSYTKNATLVNFAGTSSTAGVLTIPTLSAGSFTNLTITRPSSGCFTTIAGPLVLANPAPPAVPTAASNTPICAGDTLFLTAAGPAAGVTYSWTGPNGFTSTTQNPVRPNTVLNMAGRYTVTVTNTTTLCTNVDSTTVIINQRPTVTASNNGPVCQSTSFTLSATPTSGATYSWTGPLGYTSSIQNPTVNNAQVNQSGVYSVTATVGGCTSTASTTSVVVKPTPAAPVASNNGPLCSGNTLNLTAITIPSATYIWTGPNNFTSSTQNPVITNVQVVSGGTYTVKSILNGCNSAPAITLVIINQTPSSPTTTAISYCQFDSAVPLTAIGQNLKFYTASVGGVGTFVAPTPNTAISGTFTSYVAQVSFNGCESIRTPLVVTIKAKPVPPTINNNVIQYCQYEPANPVVANGTLIKWYTTPVGGTSVPTPTPNTNIAGTYNFYASQTVNGCESGRAQQTVIVKPKPAPPIANSPVNLCQNTGLYNPSVQGSNLKWYTVQSGGLGDPMAPVIGTGSVDSFTYYVSQTVNGCESDRVLIQIKISAKPFGFIDVSRQFACAKDTVTIKFSGTKLPGYKYFWTVPIEFGTIEKGDSTAGPLVIRLKKGGRFEVKLVVNNRGCLSDPISEFIRVRDLPIVTASVPEEGCVGEEVVVQLGTADKPVDSLQWTFGNGSVQSPDRNFGPFYIRYQTPGPKEITVRVRSTEGCFSEIARDTVIIRPKPVAEIVSVSRGEVCQGDTLTFTATFDPSYKYNWFPKRFGDTVGYETNTISLPILQSGPITLIVSTSYACSDTTSVNIVTKPCCDVVFPSAFSPNGDGLNDEFGAVNLPSLGFNPAFKDFKIFNRWGQVVYSGNTTQSRWDGRFHGDVQPIDTYFYKVSYKCSDGKTYLKSGEFTLVK